jgi:hypothetical protein
MALSQERISSSGGNQALQRVAADLRSDGRGVCCRGRVLVPVRDLNRDPLKKLVAQPDATTRLDRLDQHVEVLGASSASSTEGD